MPSLLAATPVAVVLLSMGLWRWSAASARRPQALLIAWFFATCWRRRWRPACW